MTDFEKNARYSYEEKLEYLKSKGYDSLHLRDEKKARDYYTDCLVRYPKYNVELLKSE